MRLKFLTVDAVSNGAYSTPPGRREQRWQEVEQNEDRWEGRIERTRESYLARHTATYTHTYMRTRIHTHTNIQAR